eukprot:TRINITY_DN5220_c2_g1_i1.p1 TRINITY_DN5220_c2_g1~~TRINITY_DN5220_c2_g1_i1.p1  ORF type:complete len:336 (+),score=48.21 TRINITY_DN5220_c2_g1_i1:135-1010(+)
MTRSQLLADTLRELLPSWHGTSSAGSCSAASWQIPFPASRARNLASWSRPEGCTDGLFGATMGARPRLSRPSAARGSAFLSVYTEDFKLGGALPTTAYAPCVKGGRGEPPNFQVQEFPDDSRFVHVIAEDLDAENKLLWAKVNIPPVTAAAGNFGTDENDAKMYTGVHVDPADDFIHRIAFRAVATKEAISELNPPEKIQEIINKRFPFDGGKALSEGEGTHFGTAMALAVARQQIPVDCEPPPPVKIEEAHALSAGVNRQPIPGEAEARANGQILEDRWMEERFNDPRRR